MTTTRSTSADAAVARPSIGERLTAGRAGGWSWSWPWTQGSADEVTVATVWLVLLFGLPERLVLSPLGAAGAPASILALLLLGWWLATRALPSLVVGGRSQPLRQAIVVLLWVTLLLYLLAVMRGLPGVQQRAADRYWLGLLGVCGVALVIADGVRSRERLDTLLRRLTVAGAGLAMMGLVEQFTGFIYATYARLPGFTLNKDVLVGVERGHLERISGTANHPIGYGVALSLILPLAIHYALVARPGPERQWRVAVAAVVAAGIPLATSRSAVVATGVALAVLFLGWGWRRRINALGVALVGMAAYQALVPGRLVTLLNLITNYDQDNSVTARTRDYERVFEYIAHHPWFGLGPGTFLPDEYLQLDNQALKFVLEGGLVGCVAITLLYLTGVRLARAVRRASLDADTRQLAQCFVAIVVAAGVSCFTFDAFSYTFYVGILFVVLGAAGALWRFTFTEVT
jgi:polysaccharide biosynthesis protein PslJ